MTKKLSIINAYINFIIIQVSNSRDNERFYSYLKFYSLDDLIKQGKAYLKRSNNIPMAVLGYLTPKEKRAELELVAA